MGNSCLQEKGSLQSQLWEAAVRQGQSPSVFKTIKKNVSSGKNFPAGEAIASSNWRSISWLDLISEIGILNWQTTQTAAEILPTWTIWRTSQVEKKIPISTPTDAAPYSYLTAFPFPSHFIQMFQKVLEVQLEVTFYKCKVKTTPLVIILSEPVQQAQFLHVRQLTALQSTAHLVLDQTLPHCFTKEDRLELCGIWNSTCLTCFEETE